MPRGTTGSCTFFAPSAAGLQREHVRCRASSEHPERMIGRPAQEKVVST
jgi:hypothetical protein